MKLKIVEQKTGRESLVNHNLTGDQVKEAFRSQLKEFGHQGLLAAAVTERQVTKIVYRLLCWTHAFGSGERSSSSSPWAMVVTDDDLHSNDGIVEKSLAHLHVPQLRMQGVV